MHFFRRQFRRKRNRTGNHEANIITPLLDSSSTVEGGGSDSESSTSDEKVITNLDEALIRGGSDPGNYQILLLLATGLGYMADSMEVTLLGFLYSCLKAYWDLSTFDANLILSSVFAGELAGAIIAGPLADRFGRRIVALVGMWTVAIAGLVSTYSPNAAVFIIFRTLAGVGIGTFAVPFDLVSESLTPRWRGIVLTIYQLFWIVGSLFTIGFAQILLDNYGWRALVFMCSIPVVIAALAMLSLEESPRWLLSQGRIDEAEEVVKKIARINGAAPFELRLEQSSKSDNTRNFWKLFSFDDGHLYTTLAVSLLWLVMGFTFYGISLLVVRVSGENDDDCDFNFDFLWETYSMEALGLLFLCFTVEKIGRVFSNVLFYLGAGIGATLLGWAGWLHRDSFAIGFGSFAISCIFAASSATWIITPELYPTEIRSTAHASANSLGRIGAFFASYYVDSSFDLLLVGIGLGLLSTIAAAVASCLPETAQKILD